MTLAQHFALQQKALPLLMGAGGMGAFTGEMPEAAIEGELIRPSQHKPTMSSRQVPSSG